MNIQLGSFIIFLVGLFSFLPMEHTHGQVIVPPPISVQQDSQQLVVYFEGDLTQITTASNSYLQKLIDINEVMISNTFDIDEQHKGMILVVIGPVKTAYEIAKILSQLKHVLMVEAENPVHSYIHH